MTELWNLTDWITQGQRSFVFYSWREYFIRVSSNYNYSLTPIDENKKPNFNPLIGACNVIGRSITQGAVVVFESTVYPGATRESAYQL